MCWRCHHTWSPTPMNPETINPHFSAGAQGPLAEVLEVPALMDTCVRNGHFDEALDLRVRGPCLTTQRSKGGSSAVQDADAEDGRLQPRAYTVSVPMSCTSVTRPRLSSWQLAPPSGGTRAAGC